MWETLAGQDFSVIYLPLKKDYLDWALQNSDDLQNALLNFSGVCSIHYPGHKLLQAFASLGIPQEICMGPHTYPKKLGFLINWRVCHTFTITHSPTGQAIIERTHHTLKCILDQQKGEWRRHHR